MLQYLSANPTGGGYTMILMLVAVVAVFYFMILRPESKKKKEAEQLRASLHKGDQITTIGGIEGKIVNIKDDKIVIESGEDMVRLELQKWAVMTNHTAEKDKVRRAAEAREAAQKAKEDRARAKQERKENR